MRRSAGAGAREGRLGRLKAWAARYQVYLLGIIGWGIVLLSYPIAWQLPIYAEF
ncbi:hypothetical protein [Pelagibius sp.]|uniref:hypothetical protein n=1 Tax=Pelagibius sp. TaxID=1931238 RepID=UPI003BB19BA2